MMAEVTMMPGLRDGGVWIRMEWGARNHDQRTGSLVTH